MAVGCSSRFTDRRQWLGSDYMLEALNSDPSTTHKRLGDGFYEQRLVREQITQITGQRCLEGHNDDQAQFTALMNAGITFAEAYDLRPGVALTAEQMAQLTSDIVWLVEQNVELDDGSSVTVLVPQVYARLREGDLKGDGTPKARQGAGCEERRSDKGAGGGAIPCTIPLRSRLAMSSTLMA
ncbi:S-layer family protein [Halomonas sp. MCCC 1A11036]|uniref:S-layer family protein n=1 Tax=Billgrantia zhangzhouensis TaxID=2733481 RepID=A0ABS9AJE4_9GAMM|nr:S-layer family protein [Halomonas zhangzhouensis]MCE8021841.1 S-layer family protein [Halomonas zhangzhouensis]